MDARAPRCVVTGHIDGRAMVLADGPPADPVDVSIARVWPVLRLEGTPAAYHLGAPTDDGRPLTAGGVSVQVMQLPPADWPEAAGWRQSPTQDLQILTAGRLVLGLDHDEVELAPGDTIVQRGARHRMRAVDGPATVLVAHLAPTGGGGVTATVGSGDGSTSGGVRRVVTGTRPDGSSEIVHDGAPPGVHRFGPRAVLTDVWQTGGPLERVEQGGDLAATWRVEPVGVGVAVGMVELPPGDYTDDANWHTTTTIDVDVILTGSVELHLRDLPGITLQPGDLVVQRGTDHRWQPLGDQPMRMATLRIGVDAPPPA